MNFENVANSKTLWRLVELKKFTFDDFCDFALMEEQDILEEFCYVYKTYAIKCKLFIPSFIFNHNLPNFYKARYQPLSTPSTIRFPLNESPPTSHRASYPPSLNKQYIPLLLHTSISTTLARIPQTLAATRCWHFVRVDRSHVPAR